MKATAIRTAPSLIEIQIENQWYPLGGFRETLNRQGVTLMHPDLKAGSAVILQDPTSEDSEMDEIDNAVRNQELAEFHRKWAKGGVPDGEHEISLTL